MSSSCGRSCARKYLSSSAGGRTVQLLANIDVDDLARATKFYDRGYDEIAS